MQVGPAGTSPSVGAYRDLRVCLLLAVATAAVYWQVHCFDFVNFDDDQYVTSNRHVQQGLTPAGIGWAFTTTHAGNWHPLTWLSHMLDCQLFGLQAGGHHVTSVLLHIANALLVFFLGRRLTASARRHTDNGDGDGLWQCALVAALFALHPLRVESVVWVSERKDVLSTFFWLLTMWSYVGYVAQPTVRRYVLVILWFACGLMSKPMLVTLPFALLLLDCYPLARWRWPQWSTITPLVLEKAPLLVLAGASSAVTLYAQSAGGAVSSLHTVPFADRVANALVSYVSYMGKAIYPTGLSVLYPYQVALPWWQIAGSCVLLVAISVAAMRAWHRSGWFAVGWLWYLGTLVPVIGLVQVGQQSMADRYTYVPLLGLFVIVAAGLTVIARRWRHKGPAPAVVLSAGLVLLAVTTWKQAGHWKDSITLFEHAQAISPGHHVPHINLGNALVERGRTQEAVAHYRQALQLAPESDKAHSNLGYVLDQQGQTTEAIGHYLQALRINPEFAQAHNNLGNALSRQGRTPEAIERYRQALQINPEYAEAHYNLAILLRQQNQLAEAIEHYLEALRLQPGRARVHNNLANALGESGRMTEAIEHYRQALQLAPDMAVTHKNLASALLAQGRAAEAVQHYLKALEINPDDAQARADLEQALRAD